MGDRINAEYSVVNVQGSKDNREVGTYHFSKVRRSGAVNKQGDHSGRRKPPVDLVLTLPAAGGLLL